MDMNCFGCSDVGTEDGEGPTCPHLRAGCVVDALGAETWPYHLGGPLCRRGNVPEVSAVQHDSR